jgi:hypothetical protein
MSNLPTVIAVCGPAGSGKSTVANYLYKNYGATFTGFAKPLKEMVRRALDFTYDQVYGTQEQKEAIDPRYSRSPRWFLQRIGTEGCRGTFGPGFWTKQCLDSIVSSNSPLTVIEDLRFADEAIAVLDDPRVNGFVWRLHPVDDGETLERALAAGTHPSEEEWRALDASLEIMPRSRGIAELHGLVDAAMTMTPYDLAGGVL